MCRLAVYRKDGFIAAVTVDRNSSATNFNCQQLDFGSFPVQPDDRIVLTCTIPAQNPFGGTSGVCTYKTK